jgi:probable HAF family extracellular repeat protein
MPHKVCGFLRRPRLSARTTAFFDELNLASIRRTVSPLVAFDDPLSPTRAVGATSMESGATQSVQSRTPVLFRFRVALPSVDLRGRWREWGTVIGIATTADERQHAFVWTQAGGMVDLGTVGGETSWPTAHQYEWPNCRHLFHRGCHSRVSWESHERHDRSWDAQWSARRSQFH